MLCDRRFPSSASPEETETVVVRVLANTYIVDGWWLGDGAKFLIYLIQTSLYLFIDRRERV